MSAVFVVVTPDITHLLPIKYTNAISNVAQEDQVFLGGRWSPESLFAEMAKLRDQRDAALEAAAVAAAQDGSTAKL